MLPADGVTGNIASDETEAVMDTVSSDVCSKNDVKKSIDSATNKKKMDGFRYFLSVELVCTIICTKL